MEVRLPPTRLSRGRSTPEIRAIALPLPLLVAGVGADHPYPAAPAGDATFLAHLLCARSDLHVVVVSPGLAAPGARITHAGGLEDPTTVAIVATSSAVHLLQDVPAHTHLRDPEGPDGKSNAAGGYGQVGE